MFFTIAIPAYRTVFLKETLESCLSQSYGDFEVIVLDDASPEDISGVCSGFSDARLKYFRNDVNVGPENLVKNWNRCLELASGDYFICMGDDDRLTPDALKIYSDLMEKYPGLNVYHGQTEVIDEEGNLKRTLPCRPAFESVYSLIWNRWNGRNQQYVGDFCYDTAALKRAGGYEYLPLAWGSDDITAVKAAAEHGIANTEGICFQYREHGSSISNSLNQALKMRSVCKEGDWFRSFLEHVPENQEDAALRLQILAQLADHFRAKKIYTVWCDLRRDKSLLFKWMSDRHNYGITLKDIAVALKRAL